MEKIIQSKFFYFFLGLFLAIAIPSAYAAWNDPVSDGDPLTATKWNNLVNQVESMGGFNWSDVPSGTHCGVYMETQSTVQAYEPCQGHNPKSSCPSGFKRADLGYFEAGSGDRQYAFCIKE